LQQDDWQEGSSGKKGDMGRIVSGWRLAKLSFALIAHDKRLLLFPFLSIVATVIAAIVIFAPVFAWWSASGGDWPWIVGAIVAAWALNFIGTFFGVAFIAGAQRSIGGQTWTLGDGLNRAWTRVGPILLWSLVSTVVGLLLQALERARGGWVVNIFARWVLGAAWSLATFFIVPVLALEGVGPVDATRRSIQIVRKRWGEGVVGATAIGGIYVIVMFASIALGILGLTFISITPVLGVALLVLAIVVFALGIVANVAVSQLFRFVLYEYAVANQALGPIQAADLDAAFKPRRRLFGRF
jgi:hypothetical protein